MGRLVILLGALALLGAEAQAELRIRLVARVAPICGVERAVVVPQPPATLWTIDLSCNLERYVLSIPGARGIRDLRGSAVRAEVLEGGGGIAIRSLSPGAQRITFRASRAAPGGAPIAISLVPN